MIDSLTAAEPVGPKKMFDLLIVSPCTGNTLSKLANGIYDTPVTLGVKSHLRNSRNVLRLADRLFDPPVPRQPSADGGGGCHSGN